MCLEPLINEIPFVESLGIEVTTAAEGHAEAELPLRDEHTSNPQGGVAHGGITFSLADTVGGAAVVRRGGSVAVVNAEVHDDADGHHVATACGVYETGSQDCESPWAEGVDREEVDFDDPVG